MRTGTVVKASRKQIGIEILWDGDERPTPSRHDHCVNGDADATDLLDGRGVRAGMRVESVREGKFRLTGEVVAVEASEEPRTPTSNKSPERLHAEAMAGSNQQRVDEFLRIQGPPRDPDKDEELLYSR